MGFALFRKGSTNTTKRQGSTLGEPQGRLDPIHFSQKKSLLGSSFLATKWTPERPRRFGAQVLRELDQCAADELGEVQARQEARWSPSVHSCGSSFFFVSPKQKTLKIRVFLWFPLKTAKIWVPSKKDTPVYLQVGKPSEAIQFRSDQRDVERLSCTCQVRSFLETSLRFPA